MVFGGKGGMTIMDGRSASFSASVSTLSCSALQNASVIPMLFVIYRVIETSNQAKMCESLQDGGRRRHKEAGGTSCTRAHCAVGASLTSVASTWLPKYSVQAENSGPTIKLMKPT